MFVNFGETEQNWCLPILQNLRQEGISAEIYPESAKMKKQMSYANARQIPFVALVGEDEIKNEQITLKNMMTGEQQKIAVNELVKHIKSLD